MQSQQYISVYKCRLIRKWLYKCDYIQPSPGYWQLIQQYYLNSHNRHQHSVFHFYCHMIQWEETEANRNVVSKLLTETGRINQFIRFMIVISFDPDIFVPHFLYTPPPKEEEVCLKFFLTPLKFAWKDVSSKRKVGINYWL